MSLRVKILLLISFLAVSTVIFRLTVGTQFEASALIATLRSYGHSPLAFPVFALLFGVGTTLFTPAVAFFISAGVVWGFWPGWLLVWLASNLWSHLQFFAGRWVAGDAFRAFLERRGAAWLMRELDHGGVLTTVMVRQLPLPYVLVNMAAGASPLPWRKWLLGNALGLLPNCLIYPQLAAALAEGASGANETLVVRVLLTSTCIIGLSLLSRWLQRRFAKVNVSPPR